MADNRTFLYDIAGNAHIAVHGTLAPNDEEWQAYLEHILEHVNEIRGVIVNTTGGGPTAAQRRAATEHWNRWGSTPRMAIMTVSPVVRGMVTALSWFLGTNIRAFSIDAFADASKHLGLSDEDVGAVKAMVEKLRPELTKL
ncbi:STAS/SEC14 domain-containing protein [Nannocystaceae bacterium ST9]